MMSTYQLYHPTYTSAINAVRKAITDAGFAVTDEEMMNVIGFGDGRPKEGNTTRASLVITKNGKAVKKMAHLQVYNRGHDIGNCFELNFYLG